MVDTINWCKKKTFLKVHLEKHSFIYIYIYIYIYYCLITVVPIFPPLLSSALPTPHLPLSILPPIDFVHGSYICSLTWPFPFFSHYPPPHPLWSLPVSSLFPSLWFYFAHLFCWLGSTYRVRSYGVCLSLPGLFHLA